MDPADDVTRWISKLGDGDADAAQALWEKYFDRLVHLARRKLEGMPRRAIDEEDVALSALHSFCRGVTGGRFPKLDDRRDLWKLLVTITARKAYAQMKRNRAEKRGGGTVRGESVFVRSDSPEDSAGIEQVLGGEPTPELAAMVAENCEKLLAQLDDPQLVQIARLKLEGYTNDEIAEQLDCVTRTVERKLDRIRRKWSTEATEE